MPYMGVNGWWSTGCRVARLRRRAERGRCCVCGAPYGRPSRAVTCTPAADGAPAECVRWGQEGQEGHRKGRKGTGVLLQATTRRPSTCGCRPRVHSGLPPREDRASNLVGPVRDIIGLVGWRRLFRAVRHIGRKRATRAPSVLQGPAWTPRTRGACSARTLSQQRARAARASGGCNCA